MCSEVLRKVEVSYGYIARASQIVRPHLANCLEIPQLSLLPFRVDPLELWIRPPRKGHMRAGRQADRFVILFALEIRFALLKEGLEGLLCIVSGNAAEDLF